MSYQVPKASSSSNRYTDITQQARWRSFGLLSNQRCRFTNNVQSAVWTGRFANQATSSKTIHHRSIHRVRTREWVKSNQSKKQTFFGLCLPECLSTVKHFGKTLERRQFRIALCASSSSDDQTPKSAVRSNERDFLMRNDRSYNQYVLALVVVVEVCISSSRDPFVKLIERQSVESRSKGLILNRGQRVVCFELEVFSK